MNSTRNALYTIQNLDCSESICDSFSNYISSIIVPEFCININTWSYKLINEL
jgi:hypothetical protein